MSLRFSLFGCYFGLAHVYPAIRGCPDASGGEHGDRGIDLVTALGGIHDTGSVWPPIGGVLIRIGRPVGRMDQLDMCGESRLSQGLDDGLARRVSHRLVILGYVCDWTDEDVRVLTGGVCDTPIIPHRMGMELSLGL
uniref:Uncharacterized protein n=1 Tax=Ananas comosus var. bracteatus TaxID=296719 RepID=A0A6V7NVT8_ANACO|nr:unnamed protein product [Ananas comosus var. bracteatus]